MNPDIFATASGDEGCGPFIKTIIKGEVGIETSLIKTVEGTFGHQFRYPVLGHQSGVLVLGQSLVGSVLIGDETYFASDHKPASGIFDVQKTNYQVTQSPFRTAI